MTAQPGPLYSANFAQSLARNPPPGDAAMFNKVALACMVTVALGSALQVIAPVIQDLFHKQPDQKRTKQMFGDDNGRCR